MIVGAILTQNTSWTNVELAIANLRRGGLLSLAGDRTDEFRVATWEAVDRLVGLLPAEGAEAESVLRDSCARNIKARCERMFATPTTGSCAKSCWASWDRAGNGGFDSALRGKQPVFVVDAYTKRMLARHGWIGEKAKYDDMRWMFERQFPGDVEAVQRISCADRAHGKDFLPAAESRCATSARWGAICEEGR